MRNLILLAPPAAGKGTQSDLLEKRYHLVHISTGDLLREAEKKEDELGKYIKETIAKGEFISDDIIYEMLENRINSPDCKNGFILDGFPRNMEQAIHYEEILKKLNISLGYVFQLDAPYDILEERMIGRRLCKNCGSVYNVNIEESKPKVENVCDKCGGVLYQRTDDNESSFKVRYDTYMEKTKPLIDYYKEKGNLYVIDSSKSKEEAFDQMKKILDREMI